MKSLFQMIAAAACAMTLVACGGGSGGGSAATPPVVTPPATGVAPPTTLKIEEVTIGTGAQATAGKTASVRYTGYLYDGTKGDLRGAQFDSNAAASAPLLDFVVNGGRLITGFNDGVVGMKVGGKRIVTMPPSQAYGPNGTNGIPGNATLIFEIELISVK